MNFAIGALIALAVGLTGIGGGSFTVPALVLLVGLSANASVGTAFVFAGVLRLIATPFYLAGRHVHGRYLWLLLQGAIPGLLIGTLILRLLSHGSSSPVVILILGLLLTASSSITFLPRVQYQGFAKKNSRWLPWLALPIGVESGFSSAGAGALGISGAAVLNRTRSLDAAGSGGHGHSFRTCTRGDRQRDPVEIWVD